MSLTHQRCLNHEMREAAARCPECGGYFCRECVTEHEDRVLCTSCLRKRQTRDSASTSRFQGGIRAIQFFIGFLTLWLCFYYFGQMLITLPTEFHEGTFL